MWQNATYRNALASEEPVPRLPARYGKTITIERRITHKSSSYFLFNARGHKVVPQHQSAAREVQAMLEFFSIDGGNPLTIVTQEMAKTFVSGRDHQNALPCSGWPADADTQAMPGRMGRRPSCYIAVMAVEA